MSELAGYRGASIKAASLPHPGPAMASIGTNRRRAVNAVAALAIAAGAGLAGSTASEAAQVPPPKASPAELSRRASPEERRSASAKAEPPPDDKGILERPTTTESLAPPEPAQPSTCQLRLSPDVAVIHALPPITGPGECTADDVVQLDAVKDKDGRAIAIAPPATLRCGAAESVVQWIRDDVAGIAEDLGGSLNSVAVDTSFECRSRNRTAGAKLSEHGHANAVYLRGLTLANGKFVSFTDIAVDKDARERLRQAACARFTTVLGPGSDGYHENHIHLDVIVRRGGYRICQWDVRDAESIASVPLPPESSASAPSTAKAVKSGTRQSRP